MRIFSWNVNGIRAVRNKGFLKFIKKFNPDILCLQEIKAEEVLMKALDDWTKEQGATCGNDLSPEDHEIWECIYHKIKFNSDTSYPMDVGYIQEFANFCKESDKGFKIG